MLGRQVRVSHRHTQRGMTQDLLKRNYVPSPHDEVSGKGVPKDMACLTAWWFDRGCLQNLAKRTDAVREVAMKTPMVAQCID